MTVSDLIDTTEMYLKTIFELGEEGTVPLRARIAQRLHQSGPTVSQTVARMERDGLVIVQGDRHLELTAHGMTLATRVMRKHRLVERLLVDIIGLDWELVHIEACRWEHVVSEAVERRLVVILSGPEESPYGNPIPGLRELGDDSLVEDFLDGVEPLDKLGADLGEEAIPVRIRRISEPLQSDPDTLTVLRRLGATPGGTVEVSAAAQGVLITGAGKSTGKSAGKSAGGSAGKSAELSEFNVAHIFVQRL